MTELMSLVECKIGVSIIDSIPHCHTEMPSKGAKRIMASFLYNGKNGIFIIDSIPHCHIENALKIGKN